MLFYKSGVFELYMHSEFPKNSLLLFFRLSWGYNSCLVLFCGRKMSNYTSIEPAHEIMVLFVFRKFILQTHAQPSSGDRCPNFGRTLRLLSYFMCANSEGSGETARMRRFAWALAGRLCDKYYNIMSWLNCCYFFILTGPLEILGSDIWKQNTAHIPGQGGIEGCYIFQCHSWTDSLKKTGLLFYILYVLVFQMDPLLQIV